MSKAFTKNRVASWRLMSTGAALIAMLIAPFAIALDDDREQPLHVGADSMEHNELSGVTVYTGNVVITQGSMRIEADTVTLKSHENRVENMVAVGKPARMQQQPKPEDATMYARAQRIIYYVTEDRVRLLDKATIEQEDSVVNSDEIEYLVKQRFVKAHGGIKGEKTGEKPKRVEFIYTPQKAPDAAGADAAPTKPDDAANAPGEPAKPEAPATKNSATATKKEPATIKEDAP